MASEWALHDRACRVVDARRTVRPFFPQPIGYRNRHDRRKAEAIARTGRLHEPEKHERAQPAAAPINAEKAAPEVPPA